MNKVGIITFHNSYNCGSMLESYAMQTIIKKRGAEPFIIDFSNYGQQNLYSVFPKSKSIKGYIKNCLAIPGMKKIKNNNKCYEQFKKTNFNLTKRYSEMSEIEDEFDVVVAGSDQIWNITIEDGDDAYFLPWVKKAKKVAYAPSFGSKNILKYSKKPQKYKKMINDFDCLSIRENNGKKWIKELCNKEVEVLLDPTLLLNADDYEEIIDNNFNVNGEYIFFYCPSFDKNICKFVKKISKKYNLKVITWSTKSYFYKFINRFGFELVPYESPSLYLKLMKNARLVITTSYHGTIFSTIYKKDFITVKNGGMYGDDDRVITLLKQLNMMEQLIPFNFEENFNYLRKVNYSNYEKNIKEIREKSINYIDRNIIEK